VRSVLNLAYDDSAAAAHDLAGFAVAHKVGAAALWTRELCREAGRMLIEHYGLVGRFGKKEG
jgi:hypothetical protein